MIKFVSDCVFKKTGIRLETEIKIIGKNNIHIIYKKDHQTFSDGDTLEGADGTAYTVNKTGGRLYKYTKTATTFNDIQKVPFEFHL